MRNELIEARTLIEGLLTQFDHLGCTCTFPSKECCSYARAVYFNPPALAAYDTDDRTKELTGLVEAAFREGYSLGVVAGGNQGVEWPMTGGKALNASWNRSKARTALKGDA
jgi:hypothetical protein